MTVIDTKLKSSVASEEILKWVKTGRFSPGERLPSERAMAKELRMNHLTVRRGLSELVSKGIIQKRRNVGNFVAGPATAVETAIVLPRYVLQGASPHPYFSHVVAGIQGALGHASPATLILSYRPGHLWEDVGNALVSRRIGGVILGPGVDVAIEDVRRIRDAGIEIVLIKPNLTLMPLQLCSVLVDVMSAMAALIEGVLQRGHRNIAVVQYQHQMRDHERLLVEHIFRRWGLPNGPRYVEVSNTADSIDFSSLSQVFEPREGQPLPTAVVLFDEFMASAMFRLCFERNIRIPADISVTAVQDSAPATHPIPLTAGDSATSGREQGRVAVEMLSRLVAGERLVERQIYIASDIRWHSSLRTVDGSEPRSDGRV